MKHLTVISYQRSCWNKEAYLWCNQSTEMSLPARWVQTFLADWPTCRSVPEQRVLYKSWAFRVTEWSKVATEPWVRSDIAKKRLNKSINVNSLPLVRSGFCHVLYLNYLMGSKLHIWPHTHTNSIHTISSFQSSYHISYMSHRTVAASVTHFHSYNKRKYSLTTDFTAGWLGFSSDMDKRETETGDKIFVSRSQNNLGIKRQRWEIVLFLVLQSFHFDTDIHITRCHELVIRLFRYSWGEPN